MARPGASPFQQFVNTHFEFGKRCKQGGRIHVSLDSGAIADVHPGLVDIDAPVHAHDVPTRCMQFAEEAGSTGSKVDYRSPCGAYALDQCARVRRDEADIVIGSECAHPAIEYLDYT